MNSEEEIGSQPSQQSQKSQRTQDSFDFSDIDDWLDLEQPPVFKATKCSLATKYPSKLYLPRSTQTTANNNSNVDSGFDFSPSPCHSRTQPTLRSHSFENENPYSAQELSVSTTKRANNDIDSDFGFAESSTNFQRSSAVTMCLTGKTISSHQSNLPTNAIPHSDGFHSFTQSSFFGSKQYPVSGPLNHRMFSSQSINSTSCSSIDSFGDSLSSSHLDTRPQDEEFNEPDGRSYEQIDETNDLESFQFGNSSGEEDLPSRSMENMNHEEQPVINPDDGIPGSILPEIQPILNLFAQIKSQYSDYAFVHGLAAHMCRDIYPKNYNISLKTALLLSIVSGNVSVKHFHGLGFR